MSNWVLLTINGDVSDARLPSSLNSALLLARYFGTSERFRLNLQAHYDLETECDRLGASLQKEVQVLASGE